jgi:hypothetical protein
MMAQGNEADSEKLLLKLVQSVRDGTLKVYLPESKVPFEPIGDIDAINQVFPGSLTWVDQVFPGGITWVDREYDKRLAELLQPLIPHNVEAYWDDLNAWPSQNKLRITYQFKDPSTSSTLPSKAQSINDKKHHIKQRRGCAGLILENWDEIESRYGNNPTGKQVLHVLRDNIEKHERLPIVKTIQNRLSELRKEGSIPRFFP